MNKDRYLLYGLALVGGVGIAVWVGVPLWVLAFLACPLMMFFMMRGMGDMHQTPPISRSEDDAERR